MAIDLQEEIARLNAFRVAGSIACRQNNWRPYSLGNYFDMTQTVNIFDYIPPQKTNQIFTPRWVVERW